jgi:hypothetical protein
MLDLPQESVKRITRAQIATLLTPSIPETAVLLKLERCQFREKDSFLQRATHANIKGTKSYYMSVLRDPENLTAFTKEWIQHTTQVEVSAADASLTKTIWFDPSLAHWVLVHLVNRGELEQGGYLVDLA